MFYQTNVKKKYFGLGCHSMYSRYTEHMCWQYPLKQKKKTPKTHFYMILHQFNAKNWRFSLFSNIFIFTSLAINYSPKLLHQSICHSFHQTLYSFHRNNYKNSTKINRFVMISLLVGDQQAQN